MTTETKEVLEGRGKLHRSRMLKPCTDGPERFIFSTTRFGPRLCHPDDPMTESGSVYKSGARLRNRIGSKKPAWRLVDQTPLRA